MSGPSRWARLRRLISTLLELPDRLAWQSQDSQRLEQGLHQGLDRVGQQLTALADRIDPDATMARLADAERQASRLVHQMDDSLTLLRVTEERGRHLARQLDDALALLRATEERGRHLARQLDDALALLRATEARTGTLLDHATHRMDEPLALLRVTEERGQHLARQSDDALALLRATEARTGTLLDHAVRAALVSDFIISQQHAAYVEAPERLSARERPAAVAARALVLEAAAPIALDSADHLLPQSTEEGVVRPTGFVAHCRSVLAPGFACLDLGTGGAGLVYEFVMQDVLAIGLDGSDHNRRLGRGYWPVLPDNLRTCDVTRSFSFRQDAGAPFRFGLITAWEMLEHIPEAQVPGLLVNVRNNLAPGGWFAGSVSLLEYVAEDGEPYHVTLQPRHWWVESFAEAGLEMVDEHPFDVRSFPRGNGPRFQDFHNYRSTPTDGFHFVARQRSKAQ